MQNEIVPGMNTTARSFSEGPGPTMGPLVNQYQHPEQVIQPPQPPEGDNPSTIRDYLERVRSAGTVPTFTNVPGGYPVGAPGGGEVFHVGPGGVDRYGMSPGNQEQPVGPATPNTPAAMPEDQPVRGRDPYEMALTRVQHMMPDMWRQMFGDKPRDSGLSPDEQKRWAGFVSHTTNLLVKKYDKKIGRAVKFLNNFTPKSVERYLKSGNFGDLTRRENLSSVYNKAISDYEGDKISYDAKKAFPSATDYARHIMESYLEAIRDLGGNTEQPQQNPGITADAERMFKELRASGMPRQQAEAYVLEKYPQLRQ
jgi:hypothetical protein